MIAEFIGSFILVFIGAGSVAALILNDANYTMWDISMIWGLAVSLALYLTAAISGAHINPAVTLALAFYRGFPWEKVLPYILAQIGGTFTAAASVYALYYSGFLQYETSNNIVRGTAESQQLASIFSTYPAPYLNYLQAALIEVTITAVLIAAIFSFIDEKNSFAPPKALFPMAVGMVIAILGGAFGSLTGFAMNPARDFGPKVFSALVGWGPLAFPGVKGYFWIPIIAPLLGGVIGGAVYNLFIGKYVQAVERDTEGNSENPIQDPLLQEQEKNGEEETASTKTY